MKEIIIATISDLCSNFLYYDRREDEQLSINQLNKAVKDGVITIDEMVAAFRTNLEIIFNESIEHIRAVDSDCVNIKSEVLKGDYTNHFLDWKSRFFEYNPMVIEYEKRGTSERYTIKNLEKKYEIAMLQTPFN